MRRHLKFRAWDIKRKIMYSFDNITNTAYRWNNILNIYVDEKYLMPIENEKFVENKFQTPKGI